MKEKRIRKETCENSTNVGFKNPEIYYIVSIKEKYICELHLTTIAKGFCGRIENQTSTSIYFRLNGSDALVIIPHSWIEWMAPTKNIQAI